MRFVTWLSSLFVLCVLMQGCFLCGNGNGYAGCKAMASSDKHPALGTSANLQCTFGDAGRIYLATDSTNPNLYQAELYTNFRDEGTHHLYSPLEVAHGVDSDGYATVDESGNPTTNFNLFVDTTESSQGIYNGSFTALLTDGTTVSHQNISCRKN